MKPRCVRAFFALVVASAPAAVGACGSSRPPPHAAPSQMVQDLWRNAGLGIQDCGEVIENTDETRCQTRAVGECVEQAFKACRPAHANYVFYAGEGDSVRIDWIVMVRAGGACDFVVVEDRSADPLAPRTPTPQVCDPPGWKDHPAIKGCEVLDPKNCRARTPPPKS